MGVCPALNPNCNRNLFATSFVSFHHEDHEEHEAFCQVSCVLWLRLFPTNQRVCGCRFFRLHLSLIIEKRCPAGSGIGGGACPRKARKDTESAVLEGETVASRGNLGSVRIET